MKPRFVKYYINTAMRDITALGTMPYHIILLIFLFLFGQYTFFYQILAGEILIYLVSTFMKLAFFKHRPEKMEHSNVIEKIEAGSFPSVHSMRIFFVAFAVIIRLNNYLVGAFLLLLAVLVGYSRLYLKKHYPIDVVVGALLGSVIAYVIMSLI